MYLVEDLPVLPHVLSCPRTQVLGMYVTAALPDWVPKPVGDKIIIFLIYNTKNIKYLSIFMWMSGLPVCVFGAGGCQKRDVIP